MLLEYFDDLAAHDCGRCDVCRPALDTCTPDAQLEANLFRLLADGRPHTVAEWHVAQLDAERAGQLLQQFLDEGRILFDGAQLTLPTAPTSPEK